MLTTPTISLQQRTPYRLVVEAGLVEGEVITAVEWQISTVSNFATTVATASGTDPYYQYLIPSGDRLVAHYARVRITDGVDTTAWATLTIPAVSLPITPTLTEISGAPGYITARIGNLPADPPGYITAQVLGIGYSRYESPVVDTEAEWAAGSPTTITIESGPAVLSYHTPSAARPWLHLVRARVGYVVDFDLITGQPLVWESAWSSDLFASSALVADDDVDTISYYKVQRGGGVATKTAALDTETGIYSYGVMEEEAGSIGPMLVPTGVVLPYAGDTIPGEYLLCNGAAVSQSIYPDLYAVIGTLYTPSPNTDPAGTFRVPDMRQRFPLGKAASGTGSVLGGTGGAIDHTHGTGPRGTGSTGMGTQSANPPFLALNYIIKI